MDHPKNFTSSKNPLRSYYPNGKLIQRFDYGILGSGFIYGLKHGPQIKFDLNGNLIYKKYYIKGKKEGEQIVYRRNGNKVVHNYNHGIWDRIHKEYDKNGKLILEMKLDKNQPSKLGSYII